MKHFAMLLSASLLAACVTTSDPKAVGPYPGDHRKTVKAHVEQAFFDPYSLRNVAISNPRIGHLFFQQGWIICFQANAKNRMGGYTGLQRTAYLIHNDRVVRTMQRAAFCNQVHLVPWEEMENRGARS